MSATESHSFSASPATVQLSAVGITDAVRNSPKIVLYSMAGNGSSILSTKEITDEAAFKKIVAAFEATVTIDDNVQTASCFEPRHGLRVDLDGTDCDFKICFSCGHGECKHAKETTSFDISQTGRAMMNDVFEEMGVTLAPGSRE